MDTWVGGESRDKKIWDSPAQLMANARSEEWSGSGAFSLHLVVWIFFLYFQCSLSHLFSLSFFFVVDQSFLTLLLHFHIFTFISCLFSLSRFTLSGGGSLSPLISLSLLNSFHPHLIWWGTSLTSHLTFTFLHFHFLHLFHFQFLLHLVVDQSSFTSLTFLHFHFHLRINFFFSLYFHFSRFSHFFTFTFHFFRWWINLFFHSHIFPPSLSLFALSLDYSPLTLLSPFSFSLSLYSLWFSLLLYGGWPGPLSLLTLSGLDFEMENDSNSSYCYLVESCCLEIDCNCSLNWETLAEISFQNSTYQLHLRNIFFCSFSKLTLVNRITSCVQKNWIFFSNSNQLDEKIIFIDFQGRIILNHNWILTYILNSKGTLN